MILCSFNRGADKVHVVSLHNPQKLRKATKAKKPQKPRSQNNPKGRRKSRAPKPEKPQGPRNQTQERNKKKRLHPQMLDISSFLVLMESLRNGLMKGVFKN